MKYSLAIFDLDGTILDTLQDLYLSVNHALSCCNMPARTKSEVQSFVGNGIKALIERAVPENTNEQETKKVFDIFNDYYALHCADNTRAYDGITEVIKKLREKSIITAVISNKSDYAVQSLVKNYFDGLFDYCVGAKENIRKKPAPDAVNILLDKMEIKKEDAVYIGDSEVDIETARNAQMDIIGVAWGFRGEKLLKSKGCKTTVATMQDLYEKITSAKIL